VLAIVRVCLVLCVNHHLVPLWARMYNAMSRVFQRFVEENSLGFDAVCCQSYCIAKLFSLSLSRTRWMRVCVCVTTEMNPLAKKKKTQEIAKPPHQAIHESATAKSEAGRRRFLRPPRLLRPKIPSATARRRKRAVRAVLRKEEMPGTA